VLHQPTGILYLACSSPSSRGQWTPAVDRLNASARSEDDYVAIYDPSTSTVTRLSISGSAPPRGISVHGMDVVPSSSNPSELFIYLVNHRVPLEGDPAKIGADSSIEVFKTAVGRSTMTHIRTFEDPNFIVTPNDVVGSDDGKSIFSTNDRGQKVGIVKPFF
jgi:arylesterase/paraoxonase